MYPCIHGMVDVRLVCGEIKTQLPCPANVSDLWWCMRTDTANISYRNLICNEGRGKYYHYITQQLEPGPTLTSVSLYHTWSYLTLRVFYFLYFWFILMHWPYFRVGYLTIIIVLFADPVSMNYVLGLLKRFLIVYCALWQMIQPPSWSKSAAKLCHVAKIYWVRLPNLRINTSQRNA